MNFDAVALEQEEKRQQEIEAKRRQEQLEAQERQRQLELQMIFIILNMYRIFDKSIIKKSKR